MSRTETYRLHTQRSRRGRVSLHDGAAPPPRAVVPSTNPCRIANLVAMAHHVDHLVRSGLVANYADAGRLEGLSRARVSQVTNLLLLAPGIQEYLLFLTRPATGRELIGERDMRAICLEPDWSRQEVMFDALLQRKGLAGRH